MTLLPNKRVRLGLAAAAALSAIVVMTNVAQAQLPFAKLNSVYPPGAKVGATLDVTIAGADLEEVDRLIFSHAGITATAKTRDPQPHEEGKQPVPNQFAVTVKGDVPPGKYDVRAVGLYGLSNPRTFVVGSLDEVVETEPNNDLETAQEIPLGTTINGRSDGTSPDYFKISAKKGQRVIVECHAQRIDSKMDAALALYDAAGNEIDRNQYTNRFDPLIDLTAPADGEYFIKLGDFLYAGGADHFYRLTISTGPYIDFVFPPAGPAGSNNDYTIYGRNLPGGTPANISIDGKPLEKVTAKVALPGDPVGQSRLAFNEFIPPQDASVDGVTFQLKSPQGPSNARLVAVASAPVVVEKEPNNAPEQAQKITLPCEFAGQFQERGDYDWVTFEAKKGEVYWVEVVSQRLGLTTDPYMVIERVTKKDDGTEQVSAVTSQDNPNANTSNIGGAEFNTTSDDPEYRFSVPADGTYRIQLSDLYGESRGAPNLVYRLIIRQVQPDFRLVALPQYQGPVQNNQSIMTGSVLRKGGTASLKVLVFRQEGFNEPIQVTAEGLPAGVTARPVVIGPGQKVTQLVFQAADNAARWAGAIKVVGKAKIEDKEVAREARGGAVVWPISNNVAGYSRVTRDISLAVVDAEAATFLVELGDGKPLEMSRAGKLEVPVKVTRRGEFKGNVVLNPIGLPGNVTVAKLTIDGKTAAGKMVIDIKNNAVLGDYSITFQSDVQVPYVRNPQAAKRAAEAKTKFDEVVKRLTEESKQTTAAKAAADKAATDAANKAKAAKDKAAKAADPEKAKLAAEAKAAEEASKKAAAAKAAADKAAADKAAELKTAQATQKVVAKKATDTANAAKPKNTKVYDMATPVTLKITATPFKVASKPGTVKQGAKVELPIALERLYAFGEEVQLQLQVPNTAKGLKVTNVKVEKGKNDAKLVVEAAANATPGKHTLTVRAVGKFNNQNLTLDTPLELTIEEVKEAAKK